MTYPILIMSNTATYLDKTQKEKLRRVADKTNTSQSKVIEVTLYALPEDYLVDIVQNYKNDLRPTKAE